MFKNKNKSLNLLFSIYTYLYHSMSWSSKQNKDSNVYKILIFFKQFLTWGIEFCKNIFGNPKHWINVILNYSSILKSRLAKSPHHLNYLSESLLSLVFRIFLHEVWHLHTVYKSILKWLQNILYFSHRFLPIKPLLEWRNL